ncbi:MAG: hypothetical protein JW931_00015 [Methanomicrobiaceae archaeon]|nr:hypothetical protein [Methanomicrobiaceae archaeon]
MTEINEQKNEEKNEGRECRFLENKDGSPRTIPCANTYCTETATRDSTCRQISKAAGPVPLFLIPQALSKEIHETGEAVLEIRVKRTRGHNYNITVISAARGVKNDDY